MNQLHYGDNLERLRNHIPDEVADLVYLDPPFNSARNYNLLFKQHKGQDSAAQIMAFEDTWQWSPREYQRFQQDHRNQPLWKLVASLYEILGDSEMMAYVVMMAPRLLELHRKLKPTGSLYLHCDPVASHYLKIILDVIFGPENFINELVWKRTTAHSDAKRKYSDLSDSILAYAKTSAYKFNAQYLPHSEEYSSSRYNMAEEDGRRYMLDNMTSPQPRPNMMYEWRGYPYPPNGWRFSRETMQKLEDEGRIWYPTHPDGSLDNSRRPRLKRYLDEMKGQVIGNVWTDIWPINSQSKERRGYPTQKPLALLERVIAGATDKGDVVLDPFAGCGTAIVAAERMSRHWIGIDVTYLAINEIVDRLNEERREGHPLIYVMEGTPKDEGGAVALFAATAAQNHKPFEQWAVTLVGGRYNEKRGADRGIDGRIGLWDINGNYREGLVQVKGGNALNLGSVRDFANVIESNNAVFGIMIAQREPTKEMLLVAEKMGVAKWHGTREIPRYQILTTQGILERGERPIVPDAYRIAPQEGVGKAQPDLQSGLFED